MEAHSVSDRIGSGSQVHGQGAGLGGLRSAGRGGKRLEAFPTQNVWRRFLLKTPGGVFYLKRLETFST